MGRLTEYFQYLQIEPENLMEFKQRMVYIDIKDEDKKIRRKLKLYRQIKP